MNNTDKRRKSRLRRGEGFPMIITVTLMLLLVFVGIMEYVRLLLITEGIRDAVQSAVIGTVNDNYDDVYHGVREGYAGGYQPFGNGFEESIDYGNIYARLDSTLGLVQQGDAHVKFNANGGTEFRINGLSVTMQNVPLSPGAHTAARFIADCKVNLEVPVFYAGMYIGDMAMTLNVKARYTPKF